MEALSFQSHIGTTVTIDACWPCHLIWFDQLESTSLSPGSVIDLFKRIHAARKTPRGIVGMQPACPICATTLAPTNDFARGVLDTAHLVYFLAGSAWFLALAHTALASRRWR